LFGAASLALKRVSEIRKKIANHKKRLHNNMSDTGAAATTPLSPKMATVTFTEVAEEVIPTVPVNIGTSVVEDDDQDNPQEAYSPPPADVVFGPIMEEEPGDTGESPESSPAKKKKKKKKGWRRRKRGRDVRIVTVSDCSKTKSKATTTLPLSHFETIFRRRAIRKEAAIVKPVPSPSRRGLFGAIARVPEKEVTVVKDFEEGYDEEIGDTSLGMKLNM
jgi:hypothetical protein